MRKENSGPQCGGGLERAACPLGPRELSSPLHPLNLDRRA